MRYLRYLDDRLFALDGGAFLWWWLRIFGAQCFGILCIDLWAAVTGIILF